ncbi:hypothetical protein [Halomonas piscis]|uniref:hypothetical protein n=1 Tax=Halomonas piscis TaxID=3031727 RepID=UPI0028A242CB|nr:hypothetical protein [Halomonas piscis]
MKRRRTFESAYRVDGRTLAAILFAPSPGEGEKRRRRLTAALAGPVLGQSSLSLADLRLEALDLNALAAAS